LPETFCRRVYNLIHYSSDNPKNLLLDKDFFVYHYSTTMSVLVSQYRDFHAKNKQVYLETVHSIIEISYGYYKMPLKYSRKIKDVLCQKLYSYILSFLTIINFLLSSGCII